MQTQLLVHALRRPVLRSTVMPAECHVCGREADEDCTLSARTRAGSAIMLCETHLED